MTDLPFQLATNGTAVGSRYNRCSTVAPKQTDSADLKHPFVESLFSSSAGIKVTFQHIVWCLWDQF